MKQILTESVRIDGDTQSRVQVDQDAVQEYADAMAAGKKFPPVLVFFDGTEYWCADGFHRILAALRAGIKHLAADVRKGGRNEAMWEACGANQTHGIRRTNADKRKAVMLALEMHPEKSDAVLAEHCGVSREYVLRTRKQVVIKSQPEVIPPPPPMRTGRDGKQYPVPTQRTPKQPLGPPQSSPPSSGVRPPASSPVDDLGRKIPESAIPLWNRRDEINSMLTALSRVRVAIREAQELGDKLFAEVPHSATLAHLDQAYNGVQVAKPYAVCPFCQGNGCRACRERGLMSKHRWDMTVPKELKQMVSSVIEDEK